MILNPTHGMWKNSRVYRLTFVAYWGILLMGFDIGIAGGIVSQPYFQQSFGLVDAFGKTDISRTNEVSSNVVSVLQIGALFGALGSAPVSARIGRRYTLLTFTSIFLVGAVLTTVADAGPSGLSKIYAGRIISGLGIGAISAVSPAYVAECSPKDVRGRMTGLFQIMVAIGMMIAYFINYGIGLYIHHGANVWRVPFALQLVPAGVTVLGLLTVKESPRWLASVNRQEEAVRTLAYLRKEAEDSDVIIHEMAEIQAAIKETRQARKNLPLTEAFLGKGNWIRFVIAILIFVLQQFSGQISVGFYAPQFFIALGYVGTKNSLLASGIYGVLKVVATVAFVFFAVDTVGRKALLFISAVGMGTLFFVVGAILKTHPLPPVQTGVVLDPSPASKVMAAMLYIYVCVYSIGWGPLPWVYASDIFPSETRHFGLSLASATGWLFSFVINKITPTLMTRLGYKFFFMFGTIDIAGMAVFSMLIPETKGRSLEEMDVIFGSVKADKRGADIEIQQKVLERPTHESGRSESLDNA